MPARRVALVLVLLALVAPFVPASLASTPAGVPTLHVHVPADATRAFILHVPVAAEDEGGWADLDTWTTGGTPGAWKSIQIYVYEDGEATLLTGSVQPSLGSTAFYTLFMGQTRDLLVILANDAPAPQDWFFRFPDVDDGTVRDAPIAHAGTRPVHVVAKGSLALNAHVRETPYGPTVTPPSTVTAPTTARHLQIEMGYEAASPTPFFLDVSAVDDGAGVASWVLDVDGTRTRDAWYYWGTSRDDLDGNGGSGSAVGTWMAQGGLITQHVRLRYDAYGLDQQAFSPSITAAFTPLHPPPTNVTWNGRPDGWAVRIECPPDQAGAAAC